MIKKCIEYTITEPYTGCTVEEFLKSRGYSHRLVVYLRNTEGSLTVKGQPVYTIHRLQPGEVLKVVLTEDNPSRSIVPVNLPLSIVYEDEDILVINKEAGVPIHPSQGHHDNTLANAVAWYYSQKGETFTDRAINRLDRDTTGLLILAKNALSASILSAQMKKREIHRTYQAIVKGVPIPESGTIDAPIARKEGSAIERCVDFEKGERAVTHYRVLDSRNDYSLVQLSLETGRTHQIRVHMGYLGHPLLGDYLYYPDFSRIKRVSLHSYALSFTHPMTGSPLTFRAPLPEDMADLFA